METKRCTKCKTEKPFSDFPKSGGRGALSYWCKECCSKYWGGVRDRQREQEMHNTALGNFAERIKSERLNKDMTQNELAQFLGVNRRQVSMWEKGLSLPHQKTVRSLYGAFGWELPMELKADPEGRLPIEIKKCNYCNNPFPVYKQKTKFCSRKCLQQYMTDRPPEENPSWKGGKYVIKVSGYVKIKVGKNHPSADVNGYILEHRLIMEEKLGRHLLPNERIHHRNGVRDDNRIDNLELWYVAKKDPAGQRMEDFMKEFLSQPEIQNPQEVEKAFRRVFKI